MIYNWLKTSLILLCVSTSIISATLPPIVSIIDQGPSQPPYIGALANEAITTELLQRGDIGSVVRLVWAEQDNNRKLNFLRVRAQEGHAIFMYELARALSVTNDNDTLFWHLAGFLRSLQDALCALRDGEEAIQCPAILFGIYTRQLPTVNRFTKDQVEQTLVKVKQYLKAQATHPSPRWVISGTDHREIERPQVEWQTLRLSALEAAQITICGRVHY